MSVFSWLENKVNQQKMIQNKLTFCDDEYINNAITNMNNLELAIEQEENAIWYKGNPDYLLWWYTKGVIYDGIQIIMNQQVSRNWCNYYWTKSALEENIKRTHSGLPRQMIEVLQSCLGNPIIKCKDKAKEKVVNDILDENNAIQLIARQVKMDMAIGDGCYLVNVDKDKSDYPIIEWVDGRDVSYEYTGSKITGVVVCKFHDFNGTTYTCYERRSTIREKGKRCATITYKLFENDSKKGYVEVPLNTIPQTSHLENLKFNNIPFMLAVPTMRIMDEETKRGVSIYRGRIDIFDDLDQNISQEANIMRAITPVEYIDSNLLEKDGDNNPIMPSAFGKQFIIYRGSENYNQTPNNVDTHFYQIDFTKLNVESQESYTRAMNGIISPATMGMDISRKDNALAQREKEKITLQTLKSLKEYETDVIERLCNISLSLYDLMLNKNAEYEDYEVEVSFRDYATPSLSEKINTYKDAVKDGVMSVDRFILECYGDESIESQEKEKQAILEALERDKPTFDIKSMEE